MVNSRLGVAASICFVCSSPVYSAALVKCSPASGVVTIESAKASDFPVRFNRIGANKDGEIVWLSSVDSQVTVFKKVKPTSSSNIKRLKGYIGSDKGKIYIRYNSNNESMLELDTLSIFKLRKSATMSDDGDLMVCGYTPPTPTSTKASCGEIPKVGSYTSQCPSNPITASDFYCHTSQKSKWQAALEVWGACNRAGGIPTDQFNNNSDWCIVNAVWDTRCPCDISLRSASCD